MKYELMGACQWRKQGFITENATIDMGLLTRFDKLNISANISTCLNNKPLYPYVKVSDFIICTKYLISRDFRKH